ncbi:MAG: selenide, water dikinase SelD [Anaerolineales bacterium]|nr:selenide, water dikinase SelD [Anaerolineales bacterium]
MRPVQERFYATEYPDLLVGLGTPDDAAVYRLDDERALVVTTDFFTPIVDDPYHYGAIAAANALSDVYAMGGTPVLALNIAALPPNLPLEMSTEIMRGLADKVFEAGAVIAGGHTIQDKEPKVGLAVIGMAHPDRLMTKTGARVGDVLILTKPLGTGTITTAAKNDKAEAVYVEEAVASMMRLNRAAAQAALKAQAKAATDVTGFGLPGHALEMADASQVTFLIEMERLPFLTGAKVYGEQWIFPGGTSDNKLAFEKSVRYEGSPTDEMKMLVFDTQTSGGLLIAVAPDQLSVFRAEMARQDSLWWQIGAVIEREAASLVFKA